MKRPIITLALSLLASSSFVFVQGQALPKEAKKRLDYAIGNWNSRTESIGPDGNVRRTSYSDTVRKYVIGETVVEISGVDKRTGESFRAWEYYDQKEGKYCLTSISGSGQLMTMKGDLGEVFRWTSDDQVRPNGTTMAMRFTHSDFKPNSFTAVGEYSLDSGKTWRVFSRQYLTRQDSSDKAEKEGKPSKQVPPEPTK